jgi:hypothetical protein
MARTGSRTLMRVPAAALSFLVSWCLLPDAGFVSAQEGWNPFSRDARRGQGTPPASSEGTGLRPGDRPLEMPRGSRDDAAERVPGSGRPAADYRYGSPPAGAPPIGPPGAGAVEVERGELAPVEVPPAASQPSPQVSPAPSPRLSPRSADAERAPLSPSYQQRNRSQEPPPGWRPPIQPSRHQGLPERGTPHAAAPPSLGGLGDVDTRQLEDIVAGLELPSKSAAIASLWPRIWAEAGGSAPLSPAFEAIRIETLTRSGDVDALKDVLQRLNTPREPVMAIVVMRARLLVGDREQGCALAGDAIRNRTKMPASFRRDAVLAAGYCAMAGGNAEARKLTADLIRGENIDAPFALAVMEGAGAGGKATPALPKQMRALDYRIGEAAGIVWPSELVDRADPGLLAVLATAPALDPGLRVAAAERAARLNMISPAVLAEQYRTIPHAPDELAQPLATRQTGVLRRSLLARAAEEAAAPDRKALALRALLDEARQADLGAAMAQMVAPVVASLPPVPEIAWFAESAVEVLVQAGRSDAARTWIEAGRGNLDAWRLLAALAEGEPRPAGGMGIAHVERLALAGRFEASLLHRLVTVLDALDTQVPIPLWEAASRTPQPTDGHLPATGVLADLKSARDKRDGARTVLRAAQALGPAGAAEANLLTLGDVIRALKGVGLDREARALGLEALVAAWPRAAQR